MLKQQLKWTLAAVVGLAPLSVQVVRADTPAKPGPVVVHLSLADDSGTASGAPRAGGLSLPPSVVKTRTSPYVMNRSISKLNLVYTVQDYYGNPVPNYSASIVVQADPTSGGHDHGTSSRRHGWMVLATSSWEPPATAPSGSTANPSIAKVTTGADGKVRMIYIAPEMSGVETVTAVPDDPFGNLASASITVAVTGLGQLAADATGNYVLVGGTAKHLGPPLSTTDHNHWGTSSLLTALRALAKNWKAEKGAALRINDMALPTGGLFDINGTWTVSHVYHRDGTHVDLGIAPPNPDFVKVVEEQGWWGFINAEDPPPHYHLNVTGTGRVSIKVDLDNRAWQAPAARVLQVTFDVQNRGGLDAATVTITGITITGSTSVTPLAASIDGTTFTSISSGALSTPLERGTMAIRGNPKSVFVRLKVPAGVTSFKIALTGKTTSTNGQSFAFLGNPDAKYPAVDVSVPALPPSTG